MTSHCRKNNWSSNLESSLNQQINMELYASHVYLALSAYFKSDSIEYPGMVKFFKDNSNEEREHADKFIEYQNIRGGMVILDGIQRPNFNFNSNTESILLQAMKYTLELEQLVYENILNISRNSDMDPAFSDYLDEFLKEQLESQYNIGRLIKQLEHIGNDGYGLWSFDQNLFK
tara:strand:+ start:940 stop:1461 length:522 start_codon:yes stop_codon:yes gene_type:complete